MSTMRPIRAASCANRNPLPKLIQQHLIPHICRASSMLVVLVGLALALVGGRPAHAIQPFTPYAPTTLSAVANSSSQITLAWNDPNSGTLNESGYEIQRVVPPSTSWVTVYTTGPNVTSWVNSGLASSTTYSYRVMAYAIVNRKTNYSGFSPTASATTASVSSSGGGGTVPVAGAVTPSGAQYGAFIGSTFSLTTSFSSSTVLSGCQYTIDGVNWLAGTVSGVAPSFTCSKSGIVAANGQVLTLNMRATNSGGTGTGAAVLRTVDALAPASASSAPAGWVATDQIVALAGNDGSGSGVAYTQYCTDTINTCTPAATGTSVAVSCAAGTACQTYVRFRSVDNLGNVEAVKSALVRIDKVAPVSGGLSAIAGNAMVSLSWAAASDVGSGLSATTPYKLVFATGTIPACNSGTVLVNGTATSYTHSGLANGTTYYYRVCSTDAAGNVSVGATASAAPQGTTSTNQAPVANVSPSIVSTQTLTAVSFSGVSSTDADGSIASYSWNFGDGSTASGATVSHAYARAGSYTAVLTVTDNLGATGARSVPVTAINRAPIANAGADQTAAAGTSVTLNGAGSSDPDGTITSYVWSFGDGTANVSGSSVGHVYAATGTYTATLTVTDNSGATSSDTALITVAAAVAPPPTGGGAFNWVKRFGGVGASAIGYATAVDGGDNIIVVGAFWGTVNLGGSSLVSLGSSDIFVAKYSSAGAHLWSKSFGNALDDVARGVAVDASGNVFVVGSYKRSVSFGGASLTAYYSGFGEETSDMFIAKFSSGGAHLWSKSYGNFGADSANAVAVDDRDGSIAVTGVFKGVMPLGGANLTSSSGTTDLFVAKYTTDGAHLWSKGFGSISDDTGYGVAIDPSGGIAVVATVLGPVNFGGGALVYSGSSDIAVAKFDSNGNHLWSKQFGGSAGDAGYGIATDTGGNVIVTGYVQGSVNFGGGALTASGSYDTFVVKFSSTGGHVWSKQLGGISADEGLSVATDASGNVFIAGAMQGSATFGGTTLTSAGGWDAVVAKYSPAGSHLWSKRVGSTLSDLGYGIATTAAGNAIIVGNAGGSIDFGNGSLLPGIGSTDLFILNLGP